MRPLVSLLIAAALIGTGATAVTAKQQDNSKNEAKLAKLLGDRVAGKPVDCIQQYQIRSTQIIDRTAIVYDTGGGKLYVNRPRMGAESLDNDSILVTKTHSSELCSIDTIDLIDRGSRMRSGFVGLGKFVPYTKVKAARR
jgi:hypothetical protein